MGTPDFARRRRRAALGLAVLMVLLGLVHGLSSGWLQQRLFPPKEDGSWGAVSIDGQLVSPREYYLGIRKRKVTGGRDGCNFWSFEEASGQADGERGINTTLVGCEESAASRGYWAVASAPSVRMRLRPDGVLEMAALGHHALLRRCSWAKDPNNAGSGKVCVVK
jgi:hypothetical protein